MLQLWQLFQDINNKWNSPEVWEKRQQVGDALILAGQWIKGEPIPTFGSAAIEADTDCDEAIRQVGLFIDSQGVPVPMHAGGDKRAQLLELLKIALPLLIKLL